MENDYEIDHDVYCCKCGHSPLHNRRCTNFCDNGYNDEAEDDAINFFFGESKIKCPECKGTGIEWWCPSCAENLSGRIKDCECFRGCKHPPETIQHLADDVDRCELCDTEF